MLMGSGGSLSQPLHGDGMCELELTMGLVTPKRPFPSLTQLSWIPGGKQPISGERLEHGAFKV
jgi:hypothetical protein